jgi:outer membrane lipoprotein-sorting protein
MNSGLISPGASWRRATLGPLIWQRLRSAVSMGLLAASLALGIGSALAQGDATQALRDLVAQTQSGQASFTQIVQSADGKRQRLSSGSFEFQRPNRFRFGSTTRS